MISDLDDLLMSCRGSVAKSQMKEAIACYHAGAYRACIIATWIAVLFDFIHKLRELEMAGDKAAQKKLAALDAARKQGDTMASLDFERSLVKDASESFELFSKIEAIDLERLFQDRNRCAHSTMTSLDEPYNPSAELARAHMKTAVTTLLQHPPVQGKAALDAVWADVKSEYFPLDVNDAVASLKVGPLGRARRSVIREVTVGLTKDLLLEQREQAERKRQFAALGAVRLMYPEVFGETIMEVLPSVLQKVTDDRLESAVRYVARAEPSWSAVGTVAQLRLKAFVETESLARVSTVIAHSLRIPALREKMLQRLPDFSASQVADAIRMTGSAGWPLDSAFLNVGIELFAKVRSFRSAEHALGQIVLPLAEHISPAQIAQIGSAFASNDQITFAAGVAALLQQLLSAVKNHAPEMVEGWRQIHSVLQTHPYYSDEHGAPLRLQIEETFGFASTADPASVPATSLDPVI